MAILITYIILCFVLGMGLGAPRSEKLNPPPPRVGPIEEIAKRKPSRPSKGPFEPNGYSIGEQRQMLAAHNNGRRKVHPNASDMDKLTWSKDLAKLAQSWSDACLYEHPNRAENPEYNGIGQNLYIKYRDFSAEGRPPSPTDQPVILWYNEDKHYVYELASCEEGKICGHYTQVVWARTEEVGCGMAFCEEAITHDGQSYPNAWLVTCNYSPGGNYRGQKPYKQGRPCSECPNGFCKHGLCSDDCTSDNPACVCMLDCQNCGTLNDHDCTCSCAPGFLGVACEETCEDKHAYCGANPGWPTSWCGQARFPFVSQYCPALCGECTPSDGTECTE